MLLDHDPILIMEELKKQYKIKGHSYEPLDCYLGANIEKYELIRMASFTGPCAQTTMLWKPSRWCLMIQAQDNRDSNYFWNSFVITCLLFIMLARWNLHQLKKKYLSVCYQKTCDSTARGSIRFNCKKEANTTLLMFVLLFFLLGKRKGEWDAFYTNGFL